MQTIWLNPGKLRSVYKTSLNQLEFYFQPRQSQTVYPGHPTRLQICNDDFSLKTFIVSCSLLNARLVSSSEESEAKLGLCSFIECLSCASVESSNFGEKLLIWPYQFLS